MQRRFLLAKQLLFRTVFLLHLSYQRNATVNIRFFVSLFIVFVIFSKIVIFFAYFLSNLPFYSPFLSYISLCKVLHFIILCLFFCLFFLAFIHYTRKSACNFLQYSNSAFSFYPPAETKLRCTGRKTRQQKCPLPPLEHRR